MLTEPKTQEITWCDDGDKKYCVIHIPCMQIHFCFGSEYYLCHIITAIRYGCGCVLRVNAY